MAQDEITYEQSLDMMNEQGLRAECVRLKKELDAIQVGQLTQTIESNDLDVDMMRQQMEELKDGDMSLNTKTAILADVLTRLALVVGQIEDDLKHDLGSCGHK